MTDPHAAFIRAICEQPHDLSPRYAYADWLEERGDPRGEFIRVQHILSLIEPGIEALHEPVGCVHATIEDLRRRERDLLEKYGRSWLSVPGFATVFNTTEQMGWKLDGKQALLGDDFAGVEFRNGFVEEVFVHQLNDWMGGVCRDCNGVGRQEYSTQGEYGWDVLERDCSYCKGAGLIGVHGPTIVAACPIRRVTVGDREPWCRGEGDCFMWRYNPVGGVGELGNLPEEIIRLIPHHPEYRRGNIKVERIMSGHIERAFPTREAAISALSDACIAWARQRAGLPLLEMKGVTP